MASDKRDYSNFKEFPGEIKNDVYEFPQLFYTDAAGRTRIWTVRIRLVKDKGKDRPEHEHDWDMLEENQVPVKTRYLSSDKKSRKLPANTVAQFWVETGIIDGKISRHPPTYSKMKNKNKANERNSFQQAMVDARSKYLKKYEEGGRPKGEFSAKKTTKLKHHKYFPMLAWKYEDKKKHAVFPALVQPKYDGVRCKAFLMKDPTKHDVTYKDVMLHTRQLKEYEGFNHIRRILLDPLITMFSTSGYSLYIDGEFYKHGKALQDISGEVRNIEKNSKVTKDSVRYYAFDCYYPDDMEMPFRKRADLLDDFFMALDVSTTDWTGSKIPKSAQTKDMICQAVIEEVENETEMMKWYKKWLDKKYEGLMYRNPESPYLGHPTKTGTFLRSKGLLKLKKRYSDEFEVVGFKQGTKGRDKGAIIWVCATKDGEKTFNTTPNMPLEERKKLFEKVSKGDNFEKKYEGRMMTVEYDDLSKAKIPLRAKSVGFRDYE